MVGFDYHYCALCSPYAALMRFVREATYPEPGWVLGGTVYRYCIRPFPSLEIEAGTTNGIARY